LRCLYRQALCLDGKRSYKDRDKDGNENSDRAAAAIGEGMEYAHASRVAGIFAAARPTA
jgi:hypothetical protein